MADATGVQATKGALPTCLKPESKTVSMYVPGSGASPNSSIPVIATHRMIGFEISSSGADAVSVEMEEGKSFPPSCGCIEVPELIPYVPLARKLVAEMISTFILVFTGCGSVMVNVRSHGSITHVGVSVAFGLVVMIMIYSVGHISGAHMNPAVTLAFATVRHFPWTQVPLYVGAQCASSIIASFCLKAIFSEAGSVGATTPSGSNVQSFIVEIILTFILMFVVSAVATDTRAVGELAGIAVGATVTLDALFGGPVSGASMNPARTLGPAVASGNYRGIWIYIVGPVIGALAGAWGYTFIRGQDPPVGQGFKRIKSFGIARRDIA